MKKLNFYMSDQDFEDMSEHIGDGQKYKSITDFLNTAARDLVEKTKRTQRTTKAKA